MQKRILTSILALAIAAASVEVAHADAILTFTPDTLVLTPGGTVEFDGTLTNTGTTDLYLNSDSFLHSYSDLTIDDSPFIFNEPMFLSAGDSYTGAFIDVTADAARLAGSYSGMYTIQGGTDSDTFDNLATANFTVDVVSAVPEPKSFLLLATRLSMIAVVLLRRELLVCK
jgi:hypothetical protein